jgi:DNA-binding response OmpR family regulator
MLKQPIETFQEPELMLIYGERPNTPYAEDAQHWLNIYRELIAFAERALVRLEAMPPSERDQQSEADRRYLSAHLIHLRQRLEFWEERFWQLGGIDIDPDSRFIQYAGERIRLTAREAQLLTYMARRPGQFLSAQQLILRAWNAPELSPEQLRSYMVRLRRLVARLKMPVDLISEPGRGYALHFRP